MRILVLGGTHFVGRHIVEAALARGHAVSVFNRGRSALPDACRTATGSDASPVWVRESVLLEHGVEPFTELPLWPDDTPEHRIFYTFSNARAVAAGLSPRLLEETACDTWAWLRAVRAGDAPEPVAGGFVAPGLSRERETEVLRRMCAP